MRKALLAFAIALCITSIKAQSVIFKPVLGSDVISGTDPFTAKSEAAAPADTQIVVNASHGFELIHNKHNIGLLKTGLPGIDGTTGVKVSFTFTMDSSKNNNSKAFNIELGNAFTNSGSPNTTRDFAQFNISSGTGANAQSMKISGSAIAYEPTPVVITWYLNNTANSISYIGPDGNPQTLASNSWDLWTGNTIALAAQTGITGNPVNSFKITANASGVQTAEFDNLEISTLASATPVQFNPLGATYVNGVVQLDWSTASEINSSMFQVLRSGDGKTFEKIGEDIRAAGNSLSLKTYKTYDYTPLPGTDYYQIKEIDLDGKYTISNTVQIKIAARTITIMPNPATNSITVEGASGTINIYNAAGRLVKSVHAATGKTVIDIHSLSRGIYFIKSDNISGKFIKQ